MLFFNRKLRTNLPMLNLTTDSDIENRKILKCRQEKSSDFYNRHVRNEVRREFKEGDLVQFKNFNGDRNWLPGQIVSVRNPDRSYTLQNKFGNLVNRNRRLMLHDLELLVRR